MSAFVRRVLAVEASNDFYMTANNMSESSSSLAALFEDTSDFASGYREESVGGGRVNGSFLWFGPRGTFTPLHHDLTNNMLIQIYGEKRITLMPSLQVPNLYNDVGVFSAAEYPNFDSIRYPLLNNIRPLQVDIGPGDALFIPVGWWHCVEGLSVSISLSFTNFKADNHFSADYPR